MLSNFYGSQIKTSRLRLKMTLEQFAARLGVSRATQANYESGKTIPTVDYLDACASIGIDPMQLLRTGSIKDDKTLDQDSVAVELFRLIHSPLEPLDTPTGRTWLFKELLKIARRLQFPA